MKKIHQIRHNRSVPMPKMINGMTIQDYFSKEFGFIIKQSPVELRINKKKFKLWI
jgi:hypothetical protein